jgi:asparagine synthase (glutamine-hydrolysing)
VLLIGQFGNAGISWAGSVSSQPLAYQWRTLGMAGWLRESARRALPAPVLQHWWLLRTARWTFDGSAIRPAFAERIRLRERMFSDPDRLPPRTALSERGWLLPGRSICGALHAQTGRATGLEIRDPSGDARLLAFTWSIPDAVFIDPESGARRWLIRQAMAGRLPEQVRWNTQRGWQASDLTERLRVSAHEVKTSLEEIDASPSASDVVDIDRLRAAWRRVSTENGLGAQVAGGSVLMRGLMGGLSQTATV